MADSVIRLYPGNWLYNAGVIGFLYSLKEVEGIPYEDVANFKDDGSLEIRKDIFENLKVDERYFSERKISSIVGKSDLYRNYLQEPWKDKFPYYVEKLSKIEEKEDAIPCGLCYRKFYLLNDDIKELENLGLKKFLEGVSKFDMRHMSMLGPSIGGFPNGFWNNSQTFRVCPLCAYLIIHHHLSLVDLSDKSKIFVNAPSFKVMWHLNRYVKEIYGREKIEVIKELLGMSIIELALKFHIQLGKWTMMNIEVVNQYREGDNDKIEFFSLPYETILLLMDRNIASLINDIGEINVLNLVLDSKYREILDFGERVFKIGIKNKNDWGKHENDFINKKIKMDKNKNNLVAFSQKLFKLYALIEEKIGKGVYV
uniref:Type I-B CRISPR-associated protein Cas8b1/Cst1 n=1 Tax=Dictyoglomus thermophilum TaxID=14 RepID=A0A7C3RIP4_DICTH